MLLLAVVAVAGLALRRAYAEADGAFVGGWARDHSLELTPGNRATVERYLRTARVLRTWGAVAGLLLPPLAGLVFGGPLRVLGFGTDLSSEPGAVVYIFVGYLVGALYAELSLVRRDASPQRSASLVPRDLHQYLPRRLLLAQRGLAAAAAAGILLAGLLVMLGWDRLPQGFSTPGMGGVVIYGAVIIGFSAGLGVLERWLLHRPQPFVDVDTPGRPSTQASACQYLGHRGWRVRRTVAGDTGVNPA